jgi:alcohol dehydrogenase
MNSIVNNPGVKEIIKLMVIENTYLHAVKMKAIGLTQCPEISQVSNSIQMLEVQVPRPAIKEVAIQLSASAMHIDEIYAAQGTALGRFFAPNTPTAENPHLLGSSVSGVVVDLGDAVDEFDIGDEVIVIPSEMGETGSWAEYRCVPVKRVMIKPEQINHVEAAALTMASTVAWGAVKKSKVKAGSRCVVVGASGAVGNLTLQFLKSLGCHVTAVCSGANEQFVRAYGADEVIDYTQHDFGETLYLAGQKQDAVFDFVGGHGIETEALKVLNSTGRFITVVGPEKYIGEEKLSRWQFFKLFSYIVVRMLTSLISGPRYIFCATLPRLVIHGALEQAISKDIRIDEVIPFEKDAISQSMKRLLTHRAKGRIVIDFSKK